MCCDSYSVILLKEQSGYRLNSLQPPSLGIVRCHSLQILIDLTYHSTAKRLTVIHLRLVEFTENRSLFVYTTLYLHLKTHSSSQNIQVSSHYKNLYVCFNSLSIFTTKSNFNFIFITSNFHDVLNMNQKQYLYECLSCN